VGVAAAALSSINFHPFPRSDGDNWAAFSVASVPGFFLSSVKRTAKAAHKARTITSVHGISLRISGTLPTLHAVLDGATAQPPINIISINHPDSVFEDSHGSHNEEMDDPAPRLAQ
jgi:hypothetical protein